MSLAKQYFPLMNIGVERALELLAEASKSVGTETLPTGEAHGRVVAADIKATADVPPFDRSPYDGYALISADTANAPVTLRVIEEVAAGSVPNSSVVSGTAVKILTGAPIPFGADTVVKFEDTDFTAASVTIHKATPRGNLVPRGEDIRAGSLIARRGGFVTPAIAGNLAAQGIERIEVYKKARIGIISTGNELISSGSGAIRDTNRAALESAVKRIGAVPIFLGTASDERGAIEKLIDSASADMLISTGGMGKSDRDFTLASFENCGAILKIRNLDCRPGGTFAYLELERKGVNVLCLCLSGNPASAMTAFFAVVQPGIRKLCGQADWRNTRCKVILAEAYGKASPVARLLVGSIDISSGRVMFTCSERGKGSVSSFDGANALAIVPENSPPLEVGTELDAYLI
ncbi:MAG: molybdopterin molybdotransferase MoeA [Oscillospiraceae bacterium]|jgi:molybdopterin molybdotransferase|nr:molybdopterin molybdotransferase MoeA [Oscillospiraceae bacterium]